MVYLLTQPMFLLVICVFAFLSGMELYCYKHGPRVCSLLFLVIVFLFVAPFPKTYIQARWPLYQSMSYDDEKKAIIAKLMASNSSAPAMESLVSHTKHGYITTSSVTECRGTCKRLPECIMIGVPKTGTYTLINFLGIHPQIVFPHKEVTFFHREKNYLQGYSWYLDQLPVSRPGQITMEKSAGYFYRDGVPERIWSMNKNVKLVVSLRDPIDRVISCHVHYVAKGIKTGKKHYNKTFEESITDPLTGDIDNNAHCVNRTLYSRHFRRWLKQFPLQQFHFVDGGHFIVNPYSEVKMLESYIGIDNWFMSDMFHYNEQKGFYCIMKDKRELCMPDSKGRPHPELSDTLRQKLFTFFKPYNTELSEITGRNFSWFDKYT